MARGKAQECAWAQVQRTPDMHPVGQVVGYRLAASGTMVIPMEPHLAMSLAQDLQQWDQDSGGSTALIKPSSGCQGSGEIPAGAVGVADGVAPGRWSLHGIAAVMVDCLIFLWGDEGKGAAALKVRCLPTPQPVFCLSCAPWPLQPSGQPWQRRGRTCTGCGDVSLNLHRVRPLG